MVEKDATNAVNSVLEIGQSGEHELVIVGKGRFPSTIIAELAVRPAEHAELGPIGDMLASSSHSVLSSVLVVQQHVSDHMEETPVSKVLLSGGGGDSDIAATNV